jgi:hypothetical protein
LLRPDPHGSGTSDDRLRALLREKIDWDELLSMASPNGLIPLLYQHLNAIAADGVPAPVLAQLRDRCTRNTLSNLRLAAELLQILELFDENGIGALPRASPGIFGGPGVPGASAGEWLKAGTAAFASRLPSVIFDSLFAVDNSITPPRGA